MKKEKFFKFRKIYYVAAYLLIILNMYGTLTPYTPIREAILLGWHWFDFIILPVGAFVFFSSFYMIGYNIKNKLAKINLVYPILQVSVFALLLGINTILFYLLGFNQASFYIDKLHGSHVYFFMVELIVITIVVYKLYPDFVKKTIRKIRKIYYS